jgi:hypothetical protein
MEFSEETASKQHENNKLLNLELLGTNFICFGTQLVSAASQILGYWIKYPILVLVDKSTVCMNC